jgi:hypothetical protein
MIDAIVTYSRSTLLRPVGYARLPLLLQFLIDQVQRHFPDNRH